MSLNRLHLFIETPRAGKWNHRFIVGEKNTLNTSQLSDYITAAKTHSQGDDFLAVRRSVVQSQSGRKGDEVIVLAAVKVAAMTQGQRDTILQLLTKLLENEVEPLIVKVISWDTEGQQSVVVRKEISDWLEMPGFQDIPVYHRIPTIFKKGIIMLGIIIIASAAVWWEPNSWWKDSSSSVTTINKKQSSIDSWMKATYPDSRQLEMAATELSTIDKDKKLNDNWFGALTLLPCETQPMKPSIIMVMAGLASTAISEPPIKCSDAVQVRKQLRDLTEQYKDDFGLSITYQANTPPILPFVMPDEAAVIDQVIKTAEEKKFTINEACKDQSGYSLVECLAKQHSTATVANDKLVQDIKGWEEALKKPEQPKSVIKAYNSEIISAKDQQKQKSEIIEKVKLFAKFHQELSQIKYAALRQLFGIESATVKPSQD